MVRAGEAWVVIREDNRFAVRPAAGSLARIYSSARRTAICIVGLIGPTAALTLGSRGETRAELRERAERILVRGGLSGAARASIHQALPKHIGHRGARISVQRVETPGPGAISALEIAEAGRGTLHLLGKAGKSVCILRLHLEHGRDAPLLVGISRKGPLALVTRRKCRIREKGQLTNNRPFAAASIFRVVVVSTHEILACGALLLWQPPRGTASVPLHGCPAFASAPCEHVARRRSVVHGPRAAVCPLASGRGAAPDIDVGGEVDERDPNVEPAWATAFQSAMQGIILARGPASPPTRLDQKRRAAILRGLGMAAHEYAEAILEDVRRIDEAVDGPGFPAGAIRSRPDSNHQHNGHSGDPAPADCPPNDAAALPQVLASLRKRAALADASRVGHLAEARSKDRGLSRAHS